MKITCTNYYTWATCSPGSLPVFKGVSGTGSGATASFSCSAWNTGDMNAGAIEIASKCANACEVLQWYFSW